MCATRVAADASAQSPRDAALTLAAVACPLLLGRWARGQGLLQGELAARAERRARDRARDSRHAAEEERARIAADLQVAVAGGLRAIIADADALLATPDREALARVAATARAALADVRRILGVLRKAGEAAPLAPGRPEAHDPPPAPAPLPAVLLARRRLPAALADRLLAAGVVLVGTAELAFTDPAAIPTALAVAASLLWRRRAPVVAAAAVLAAIALQSALLDRGSFPLGDVLAMVVATYAIGAYAGRRDAIAGLVLIGAGATLHAAVFYPDGSAAALLGGVVLPWTVGRLVHGHRELTTAERRRNAEIERSRAADARAAVTRERVRVARELHDAVAHNISVIAIQADGAAGILERDPARARECVLLIAAVARRGAHRARPAGRAAGGGGRRRASPRVDELGRAYARGRRAGGAERRRPPRPAPAGSISPPSGSSRRRWPTRPSTPAPGTPGCPSSTRPRARAGDRRRRARPRRRPPRRGHGLVGMRERVALLRRHARRRRPPRGGFVSARRLPSGQMSIRVLIADDQSLVRAGFRLVLENHPDIEVVGEAANGEEAIHAPAGSSRTSC